MSTFTQPPYPSRSLSQGAQDARASTTTHAPSPKETVKETLISIIIAFAMAFVFRSFVIEAFIIPTGSMAPTLLGAHMRFAGEDSGTNWAVGPWSFADSRQQEPYSVQNFGSAPIVVHDPMTGQAISKRDVPLRSGDRILVLKYLYALNEPDRYDVVVFKNPNDPSENYIKRLIGLPGEQIALVDGDVFTRPGAAPLTNTASDWSAADWRIARKPDGVQRRVWQPVYDSAFVPLTTGANSTTPFVNPWQPTQKEMWTTLPSGAMEFKAGTSTRLAWNASAPFIYRSGVQPIPRRIDDRTSYNQTPNEPRSFPVSDVRLRLGFTPLEGNTRPGVTARLIARGHEFVATIAGGEARLRMRPHRGPTSLGPDARPNEEPWQDLGSASFSLPAGELSTIEFTHVDQALRLVVNNDEVLVGKYDWTPAQRLEAATGRSLESLEAEQNRLRRGNVLSEDKFLPASVEWEFEGGPFRLTHVALDRDLYYQPGTYAGGGKGGTPALATNWRSTLLLEDDQFFCCGDNSAASLDGRLWPEPAEWVDDLMARHGMQNHQGIVPRDLLLGKAFFVYFPSMTGGSPIPVPDFGRMRFIK